MTGPVSTATEFPVGPALNLLHRGLQPRRIPFPFVCFGFFPWIAVCGWSLRRRTELPRDLGSVELNAEAS